MCNCSKISTCGNWTFSTCIKYEGTLPETSQYYNECDVSVQDTIEELYTLVGSSGGGDGIEYFNGDGLQLINRVFSVKFGTTSGTALEGSWRPDWEDIINKPTIPEIPNLIEGDNITITGTYPNLTISASSLGEDNKIENISLGNTLANIVDKTAFVPIATTVTPGLVKIGSGLVVAADGTLAALSNAYTAGNGLTLSGNQFSLPITTTGTGTFVQSIVQTSSGLTVTLGTPSGTSPQAGTFLELDQGITANTRVWSPLVLNQWLDNERIAIVVPGAPHALTKGAVRFIQGSNITITQSGQDIFFNVAGSTYTAGNGLTLTANQFSLPITYSGTGNYVTNVAQTANGLSVSLGNPPASQVYTAGNGLTLAANQFSVPVTYSGSGNYVTNVTQTANGLSVSLGTLPTNQVYTAGNGITLTSNQFSVPVTVSGAGNTVIDVQQTSGGINVVKGSPTVVLSVNDYGMVNGMTIAPNAMKNRMVMEGGGSSSLTVQAGIEEGQEVVILPCSYMGDFSLNMKVKTACGDIESSLLIDFDTNNKHEFWWSTTDDAWLALQ